MFRLEGGPLGGMYVPITDMMVGNYNKCGNKFCLILPKNMAVLRILALQHVNVKASVLRMPYYLKDYHYIG